MNLRDLLNSNEIVKELRKIQKRSSEEDRIKLWQDIQEGYCKNCGRKTDTRCHCENDE